MSGKRRAHRRLGGRLGRWVGLAVFCAIANAAPPPAPPPPSTPTNVEGAQTVESGQEETAAAQATPNHYQVIISRNVFGLKEPPPPQAPAPEPQTQASPSALKLVVLTSMLGKRASFVLQEPGKPPVNSDLLREGEKDSNITNLEVLEINVPAGTVKVNFGNKQLTLDFKSNGITPPVGPALPVAGPMVAGKPGAASAAGASAPPATVASLQSVPSAAGATYTVGGPTATVGSATVGGTMATRPIPARPVRLGGDGSTPYGGPVSVGGARYGVPQLPPAQAEPALSPEQQALIMKAQEQQAKREGIPFPPTPPVPGMDYQPPTPGAANEPQSVPQFPPVPGAPVPLPPTPHN